MRNDLPIYLIYLANKSIRHLNVCEPESKSICKCEVCARLLASHVFVSHLHHVPYVLTCLCALCAYFTLRAYLPWCLCLFLHASCDFNFYVRYVLSFLRALRVFNFSRDLLAFIFLCAYMPSSFYVP